MSGRGREGEEGKDRGDVKEGTEVGKDGWVCACPPLTPTANGR